MAEKSDTFVEVSEQESIGRKQYDPVSGVKRGLKTRHISMMALAGIIGPGVFLGLLRALSKGGPVGLLVGFGVVGILVVIMMFAIGEMNSLYDFNFNSHAARWVDPALGAAIGWNYAFLWACNIIAEYVSVTSTLSFYSDKIPMYGYYLILWGCFSVYQMFSVEVFGEVEYILAFLKILFISGFYLFAIIFAAGGIKGHSPGNPFGEYPLAHGFKGIANSFVYAAVFYTGIESLSVTFLELKDVRRTVKKAVLQSIFRIFFVYFGLSIAYGITVAWNDPDLSSANKIMSSAMTIALMRAGWDNAGYYVTTIILITCISSINSAVYFCARCMQRLAVEGYAPKIFGIVSKNGVPWVASQIVHLTGFLSLLAMNSTGSIAYGYIVGLAGVSAFIVWSSIIFTHYRFRTGWIKQGNSIEDLPFKSPLYPYANYAGVGLGIFLCLVQGWSVFKPFDAGNFVDLYIMIPIFFIMYFGAKWWNKTKWVSYEDMDFETDKIVYENNKVIEDEPEKKSGNKVLNYLWNYV